jgi:hypothetical protein
VALYYYTVSSLPFLTYEGDIRLAVEDFLSLCKDTLSPDDWEILSKVRLKDGDPPSGSASFDSWTLGEKLLRLEIAKLRAQKLGRDADGLPRIVPETQALVAAARAAVSEDSPAHAEDLILRFLWNFLDELEVGHAFDLDFLVVYYLRLQILELKKIRNKDEGRANFTSLYEAIRNQQTINI